MKTVRFTNVVERVGAPQLYLPWVPPEKDHVLRRALREQRVMTVHQTMRGTHKDYGTVGLHRGGESQFLVFPRSLRDFAAHRVVGIDYGRIAEDHFAAGPKVNLPTKARPAKTSGQPALFQPGRSAGQGGRTPERARTTEGRREAVAVALPPKSTTNGRTAPSLELGAALRTMRKAVSDLQAGRVVSAHEELKGFLAQAGG
jgi:hypothetical protein